MCYTGNCSWENHMGGCIISSEEKKKHGFLCESDNYQDCPELLDYIHSASYVDRCEEYRKYKGVLFEVFKKLPEEK